MPERRTRAQSDGHHGSLERNRSAPDRLVVGLRYHREASSNQTVEACATRASACSRSLLSALRCRCQRRTGVRVGTRSLTELVPICIQRTLYRCTASGQRLAAARGRRRFTGASSRRYGVRVHRRRGRLRRQRPYCLASAREAFVFSSSAALNFAAATLSLAFVASENRYAITVPRAPRRVAL